MAARSSALVAKAIGNCRKAVMLLAEANRAAPISRADFDQFSITTTCSIPVMMEARLDRGR